jgi:hypothetical protein
MTDALETYLGELRANRSSGAAAGEASGYGATRERLWLEYFTAEAILNRLKSEKKGNVVRR